MSVQSPTSSKTTTDLSVIVAIQGIAGSFHHEAAEQLLPGCKLKLLEFDTFREVFDAVNGGEADYGVSAVENSISGSINAVYRLLETEKLWICGEVFLRIEQFLIGAHAIDLADLEAQVTEVASHPVALAQCELWLNKHLPFTTRQEVPDTAGSVRYIVQEKSAAHLAIAGQRAAEMYNAHIIAGPINDDKHNYTRFFLLGKKHILPEGANKTSVILRVGNRPGDLYRALGIFDTSGINLSKLDSHPIPADRWHYAFYLDFEAGLQDNLSHPVIAALEKQECTVTILGSYKSSPLPV